MSQGPRTLTLQTRLESLPSLMLDCEQEVDLLRRILQGVIGTPAQRAMLLRIIKQNRSNNNRSLAHLLAERLGLPDAERLSPVNQSYRHVLTPEQKRLRAHRRKMDLQRRAAAKRKNKEKPARITAADIQETHTIRTGRTTLETATMHIQDLVIPAWTQAVPTTADTVDAARAILQQGGAGDVRPF